MSFAAQSSGRYTKNSGNITPAESAVSAKLLVALELLQAWVSQVCLSGRFIKERCYQVHYPQHYRRHNRENAENVSKEKPHGCIGMQGLRRYFVMQVHNRKSRKILMLELPGSFQTCQGAELKILNCHTTLNLAAVLSPLLV